MKPSGCVYPECTKCTFSDCKYNDLEYRDVLEQNKFDKEMLAVDPPIVTQRKKAQRYNQSEKGKHRQRKYAKSEKGKATQKRYANSEKGKAAQKRYAKSEKGKERDKRKQQKKIDSGKNAEYCRRYYYKKKMEMMNC